MRRAAPLVALLFLLTGTVTAHTGWRQLDSGPFRFIYRDQDAAVLDRVAALAPSVYDRVSRHIGYAPDGPIPVVLYGDTAAANGFYTPYPPHIALFVASPSGPWLGARTSDWLELVFVHELVHYLHLNQPIGFFGTLSRVFGPLATAASVPFMPGWMIEGQAVSAETRLTDGGRGRNPFFEMETVAPVIDGEMYGYDQAGYSPPRPPSGRIYVGGYIFVEHVAQRYGSDAWWEINRAFQRLPFLGMRRAVRTVTGVRADELYAEMVADLSANYAIRNALPAGAAVTPEEIGAWYLVGETERGLVAWRRTASEPGALVLRDGARESSWRPLAQVTPIDPWSIAVDRSGTVAVAALDVARLDGSRAAAWSDLYRLELIGDGAWRRVTHGSLLLHPVIDDARERVIAVERVAEFTRLVSVDPASGATRSLWHPPETTLFTPTISRDGRLLAVTANRRGAQDIVILDAATGTPLAIVGAPGAAAEYFPRFAGDTSDATLLFGSDRTGELAVFRADLALPARPAPSDAPPDSSDPADPLPRIAGTPIVRDRVAAFEALESSDGEIYYASYRHYGYTIRRAQDGVSPAVDSPTEARGELETLRLASSRDGRRSPGGASGAPADPPVDRSRPYRDAPRPLLWLPIAQFSAGDEATGLDVGIVTVGASLLGRHEFQGSLLVNPDSLQPTVGLQYWLNLRPVSIAASVSRSYTGNEGGTEEVLAAGLDISRPVLVRRRPDGITTVTAAIGATGVAEYLRAEPEFATDPALPGDPTRRLILSAGVRASRGRFAAPRQLFGAPGSAAEFGASLTPAVLDEHRADLVTVTSLTSRVEPFAALSTQIVASATATTSLDRDAVGSLPTRSGAIAREHPDGTAPAGQGALIGRVALEQPILLLDSAWRGFALTSLGVAAYLEQSAVLAGLDGPAPAEAELTPVRAYAVGAELNADLWFNSLPLRVSAGAALAVPHPGSEGSPRLTVLLSLGGSGVDRVPNAPRRAGDGTR